MWPQISHLSLCTKLRNFCVQDKCAVLWEKGTFRASRWLFNGSTNNCRGQLKCDGTRAATRFHFLAKWMSPFKLAGASVQSTTGSRGVRISGSDAGRTMCRGSVKSTGYSLHSPVTPSLPLPCITMCHHISTGVVQMNYQVN
jgi:hypothetical protein